MLRVVDRIIVMDEGKVRMDGPRNDVLQALQRKGAVQKKPAPVQVQQQMNPAAPQGKQDNGK